MTYSESLLSKSKKRELLKGKTIIVEFVGLPGAGKTTNCNAFRETFIKHNLSVYVFKDIKKYFYRQRLDLKLFIVLKTLFNHGINFGHYSWLLFRNGVFHFDSHFRYVKLCTFNTALAEFIKTNMVDVVILDQWIIQGLWSATIFKGNLFSDLKNKLVPFYFKVDYLLYFDIDIDTATHRIDTRNTNRSRFDKMNLVERISHLDKYNHYLFDLYQSANCENKIRYSAMEPPEKNSLDFLKRIDTTQ